MGAKETDAKRGCCFWDGKGGVDFALESSTTWEAFERDGREGRAEREHAREPQRESERGRGREREREGEREMAT